MHVWGASSNISAIRTLCGNLLLLLFTYPLTWLVYSIMLTTVILWSSSFLCCLYFLAYVQPLFFLASWVSHLQQFRVVTLFSFSGNSGSLKYYLSAAPRKAKNIALFERSQSSFAGTALKIGIAMKKNIEQLWHFTHRVVPKNHDRILLFHCHFVYPKSQKKCYGT